MIFRTCRPTWGGIFIGAFFWVCGDGAKESPGECPGVKSGRYGLRCV
jgi:hypothetical protein